MSTGYSRKIEPITRFEVIMMGVSLQVTILFLNTLYWYTWTNKCVNYIFKSDISDISAMSNVHECIKNHRSGLLFGCTLLLLCFPFIIMYIHYTLRVEETIRKFLNNGLTRSLFVASWMIVACIMCTIIPGLGIFIGYYDWEFNSTLDNNNEYIGYAMQYQFLHLTIILIDCIIIPLGFAVSLPWIEELCILLGLFQSKHYPMTTDMRNKLLFGEKSDKKYYKRLKIIYTLFYSIIVCIILFSTFAQVFDYDKKGFFHYYGGSQYLYYILFIALQFQAINFIIAGCFRMKTIKDVNISNSTNNAELV